MKNVQLHQTIWFWSSISVPVIVSLSLSSLICSGNDISISWKTGDLNELLKTFQIPLGILSLSIPFVAVTAAIHRSAQTARQIEAQQSQNNFINHFKHLEEFKKAFDGKLPIGWENLEEFHKDIYPNTIEGDFTARPLIESPNAIFLELSQQIEAHPLKLFNICKRSYIRIISELNVAIHLESNQVIYPQDILNLIQYLSLAITLTGLNRAPYKVDPEHRGSIIAYQTVADTMHNYFSNDGLILSAIESNDSVPLFQRLSLQQNHQYAGLGLAYSWQQLLKLNESRLLPMSIPKHTRDFLQSHVEPIFDMTIHDYLASYEVKDGTLFCPP